MQCVLVVYDIAGNNRRQAVADTLGAVGSRVQLSAFECRFGRSEEVDGLVTELMRLIDPIEDQIRVYRVAPVAEEAMCQVLGERTIEEYRGFWLL